MAKAPVTHDRFRISCDVEVSDLGTTIAQLTKLGLQNVTYELITDIKNFAKKVQYETPGAEFLTAWTLEHPTFTAKEATAAFAADGREKGGVYYAITKLVEKGVLKKVGTGMYSRSEVKQIAGPVAIIKKDGLSHVEFAARIASRAHGKFSSASLKDAFRKDGRSATGVGPVINTLLKKKRAKRISEGKYELIKGKTPPAAKKAAAAKANGQDMTEAANG